MLNMMFSSLLFNMSTQTSQQITKQQQQQKQPFKTEQTLPQQTQTHTQQPYPHQSHPPCLLQPHTSHLLFQ